MNEEAETKNKYYRFTFQYGQIYYEQKELDIMSDEAHLHSNMVRFIMIMPTATKVKSIEFTFQYGQIYYLAGVIIPAGTQVFTFQYGQIYY